MKIFNLQLQKVISTLMILIFIFSNQGVPQAFSAPVETFSGSLENKSALDISEVRLPSEIGQIDSFYQGSSPRTVVLIQDAHAIQDAQESIQKLILYFQKEHGVDYVAFEGASSKVDTTLLKSFPDQKRLEQVLKGYHERSELAGVNAAAILSRGEACLARKKSQACLPPTFQGVENWDLYEEGLWLFLLSLQNLESNLENLEPQIKALQETKEVVYSKELFQVDELARKVEEDYTTFFDVLSSFEKWSKPEKGNSVELFLKRADLNQNVSVKTKKEIASRIKFLKTNPVLGFRHSEGRNDEESKRSFGQSKGFSQDDAKNPDAGLKTKGVSATLNSRFQEYQTGQISASSMALTLKNEKPDLGFSDELNQLIQIEEKIQSIPPKVFFKDFESYIQKTKERLFKNETERALDQASRKLRLLKKLIRLELTREEWEEIRQGVGSGEWTAFFRGEPGFQSRVDKNLQFLNPQPLSPKIQVVFYENAEMREQAMFQNLISSMSAKRSMLNAIFVVGGFHADGIMHELEKQGISYVSILPNIGTVPEETVYHSQMAGDVSWKKYFEVKNDSIDLNGAFLRHARDQLLGDGEWGMGNEKSKNHPLFPNPYPLKLWRDQLIRDLAKQGRLVEVQEYTKYLDELTHFSQAQNSYSEIRAKWRANVDRFLSKLKPFQVNKQLSVEGFFNSQKSFTIPSFPNSQLSRKTKLFLGSRFEYKGVLGARPFTLSETRNTSLKKTQIKNSTRTNRSSSPHKKMFLYPNSLMELSWKRLKAYQLFRHTNQTNLPYLKPLKKFLLTEPSLKESENPLKSSVFFDVSVEGGETLRFVKTRLGQERKYRIIVARLNNRREFSRIGFIDYFSGVRAESIYHWWNSQKRDELKDVNFWIDYEHDRVNYEAGYFPAIEVSHSHNKRGLGKFLMRLVAYQGFVDGHKTFHVFDGIEKFYDQKNNFEFVGIYPTTERPAGRHFKLELDTGTLPQLPKIKPEHQKKLSETRASEVMAPEEWLVQRQGITAVYPKKIHIGGGNYESGLFEGPTLPMTDEDKSVLDKIKRVKAYWRSKTQGEGKAKKRMRKRYQNFNRKPSKERNQTTFATIEDYPFNFLRPQQDAVLPPAGRTSVRRSVIYNSRQLWDRLSKHSEIDMAIGAYYLNWSQNSIDLFRENGANDAALSQSISSRLSNQGRGTDFLNRRIIFSGLDSKEVERRFRELEEEDEQKLEELKKSIGVDGGKVLERIPPLENQMKALRNGGAVVTYSADLLEDLKSAAHEAEKMGILYQRIGYRQLAYVFFEQAFKVYQMMVTADAVGIHPINVQKEIILITLRNILLTSRQNSIVLLHKFSEELTRLFEHSYVSAENVESQRGLAEGLLGEIPYRQWALEALPDMRNKLSLYRNMLQGDEELISEIDEAISLVNKYEKKLHQKSSEVRSYDTGLDTIKNTSIDELFAEGYHVEESLVDSSMGYPFRNVEVLKDGESIMSWEDRIHIYAIKELKLIVIMYYFPSFPKEKRGRGRALLRYLLNRPEYAGYDVIADKPSVVFQKSFFKISEYQPITKQQEDDSDPVLKERFANFQRAKKESLERLSELGGEYGRDFREFVRQSWNKTRFYGKIPENIEAFGASFKMGNLEPGLPTEVVLAEGGAQSSETRILTESLAQKFARKYRYLSALALPGAGKGTLLKKRFLQELNALLPERQQYVYLETGDWFRGVMKAAKDLAAAKADSNQSVYLEIYNKNPEAFEEALKVMAAGELVKNETLGILLREVLELPEYKDAYGIIFDGFPRTVDQLTAIDEGVIKIHSSQGEAPLEIDLYVLLNVSGETVFKRIQGRAQEMAAQGETVRKDDMDAETIKARIRNAEKDTLPIMSMIRERPEALEVSGEQDGESVYRNFISLLENRLQPKSETRAFLGGQEVVNEEEDMVEELNQYGSSYMVFSGGEEEYVHTLAWVSGEVLITIEQNFRDYDFDGNPKPIGLGHIRVREWNGETILGRILEARELPQNRFWEVEEEGVVRTERNVIAFEGPAVLRAVVEAYERGEEIEDIFDYANKNYPDRYVPMGRRSLVTAVMDEDLWKKEGTALKFVIDYLFPRINEGEIVLKKSAIVSEIKEFLVGGEVDPRTDIEAYAVELIKIYLEGQKSNLSSEVRYYQTDYEFAIEHPDHPVLKEFIEGLYRRGIQTYQSHFGAMRARMFSKRTTFVRALDIGEENWKVLKEHGYTEFFDEQPQETYDRFGAIGFERDPEDSEVANEQVRERYREILKLIQPVSPSLVPEDIKKEVLRMPPAIVKLLASENGKKKEELLEEIERFRSAAEALKDKTAPYEGREMKLGSVTGFAKDLYHNFKQEEIIFEDEEPSKIYLTVRRLRYLQVRVERYLEELHYIQSLSEQPQEFPLLKSFFTTVLGLKKEWRESLQEVAAQPSKSETRVMLQTQDPLAEPRGTLEENIVLSGYSPEILRVEEGVIQRWEPSIKKRNHFLVRHHMPEDQKKVVIENEVAALRNIWNSFGEDEEVSADFLEKMESVLEEVEDVVREEGLQSDHVLSLYFGENIPEVDADLQKIDLEVVESFTLEEVQWVHKNLIDSLREREQSVYLTTNVNGISLDQAKDILIDREKELYRVKVFEILLNLPYGFNTPDEKLKVEEKRATSGIHQLFETMILLSVPDQIEKGQSAWHANQEILGMVREQIASMRRSFTQAKNVYEAEPDNETLKNSYAFYSHQLDTMEQVESYVLAVSNGLRTYDFVYEHQDPAEERGHAIGKEFEKHASTLERALNDLSEWDETIVEEFESIIDIEVGVKGRTLEYATAKAFMSMVSGSSLASRANENLLNFIMTYYDHAARDQVSVSAPDESSSPIVVLAKQIQTDAEHNALKRAFRGKEVVALIAPKNVEDFREPHWFLFEKAEGNIAVPGIDFEAAGLSFEDIPDGTRVLVDGNTGKILLNPTEEKREQWLSFNKIYHHLEDYFLRNASNPTLFANQPVHYLYDQTNVDAYVSRDKERAALVSEYGGAGTGLFRMEQVMSGEQDARAGIEQDERRIAAMAAEILTSYFLSNGKPAIFRLYDVAHDKRPNFLVNGPWDLEKVLAEKTGARFYLSEEPEHVEFREFGKKQLWGLFHAHLHAPEGESGLKILFSDVQSAQEVAEIESLIEEALREYLFDLDVNKDMQNNINVNQEKAEELLRAIPVGYMLEDTLAIESEAQSIIQAIAKLKQDSGRDRFLGIGTNDLMRTINVHRKDKKADLRVLYPEFIKDIATVAETAREQGLSVTVEGNWGDSVPMMLVLMAFRLGLNPEENLPSWELTPVATMKRVPYLLDHVRHLKPEDLKTPVNQLPVESEVDLPNQSFIELLRKVVQGEPLPNERALHQAAETLEDLLVTRIGSSDDFSRFVEEQEKPASKSETRLPAGRQVSTRLRLAREETQRDLVPIKNIENYPFVIVPGEFPEGMSFEALLKQRQDDPDREILVAPEIKKVFDVFARRIERIQKRVPHYDVIAGDARIQLQAFMDEVSHENPHFFYFSKKLQSMVLVLPFFERMVRYALSEDPEVGKVAFGWVEGHTLHEYGHVVDANGGIVISASEFEQKNAKLEALTKRFTLVQETLQKLKNIEGDFRAEKFRWSIASDWPRNPLFGEQRFPDLVGIEAKYLSDGMIIALASWEVLLRKNGPESRAQDLTAHYWNVFNLRQGALYQAFVDYFNWYFDALEYDDRWPDKLVGEPSELARDPKTGFPLPKSETRWNQTEVFKETVKRAALALQPEELNLFYDQRDLNSFIDLIQERNPSEADWEEIRTVFYQTIDDLLNYLSMLEESTGSDFSATKQAIEAMQETATQFLEEVGVRNRVPIVIKLKNGEVEGLPGVPSNVLANILRDMSDLIGEVLFVSDSKNRGQVLEPVPVALTNLRHNDMRIQLLGGTQARRLPVFDTENIGMIGERVRNMDERLFALTLQGQLRKADPLNAEVMARLIFLMAALISYEPNSVLLKKNPKTFLAKYHTLAPLLGEGKAFQYGIDEEGRPYLTFSVEMISRQLKFSETFQRAA